MEVRLFATLREKHGKSPDVPWHEGMTGQDLLSALEIPPGDVSIFLVGGKHTDLGAALNPDDIIAIFPPVGGG